MHDLNTRANDNICTAMIQAVYDNMIVVMTDVKGVITHSNKLFGKISGYDEAEITGKMYDLLQPISHKQSLNNNWLEVLLTGHCWQGELCLCGKNGKLFYTQTTVAPQKDEQGKVIGYVSVGTDIASYKLSLEHKDEAAEKYRIIFDYSPNPMWIYNLQTLQFLDVNLAAIRNYGYTRDEFMKMTIRDIRPAEDMSLLDKAVSRVRDLPYQQFKGIFRHLKKDGSIIKVNIQSNSIKFEGQPSILVLATDVTEEMEAKVALSLANMRLTTAQEIAKLGYWSNDLRKHMIHWSDEVYNIFELDKEKFTLTFANITEQYHPEDKWRMHVDVNATFADKEIDEFDNRIVTTNGKTKWIHQKIRLIRDSDNTPIAIEGVVQDVTENKEKEQRLEEGNERYRLLMKASREALIDWDIVRDVTIWGDGFATIFGYDLSVYDNFLWSGNIHPEDREQVLKDLEQTLANPLKKVFYADFRFMKANQEVAYVQHRGLIVRDKNGNPVRAVGSLLDMTEMMERNIKIENQNKAFSEIAWIQSHKVRRPLTSLMGLVNVLQLPPDDTPDDNLIDLISIAANELDKVIHEIVEKSEKVVFDE